jgi:transglutaminase-like putative cysteine protease
MRFAPLFILHCSLFTAFSAFAQDEYRAATIPATLREKADAVIRRHETVFVVKSPGEAVETIHTVVTVLKPAGDDQAELVVPYDKFDKVLNLEGTLYDAEGKVIKKLKKADIEDYSTYTDGNFSDDNRFKAARFPKQPNYPYTVEFRLESRSRNLMFYPAWYPQGGESEAVEQATFTVDMPRDLAFRFKSFNLPDPVRTPADADGRTTCRWQVTNLPAREAEPQAPPTYELRPAVFTAPTEFEVQDYRGNLRTWNDLGLFYNALNVNRDVLPDAVRQQVADLTAGEKTTLGKVQKVYQFMQAQTRYVSIQLGIGGWQTIDAATVAERKYGDCKALVNYTKALLKAAGVPAQEALVRAGGSEPDILTDFPAFRFNHIVLCVPDGRDSLWLECTSQTNPTGYMSDFAGGRHALLMTPTGGKLVVTPTYRPTDNRQYRRVALTLTETGDATATATSVFTGLQHDDRAEALYRLTQAEQKSWLLKQIRVPTFDLTAFGLTEQKSRVPAVTETLSLTIRKWATQSGTRLFLPLNVLSATSALTSPEQPRVSPLVLGADWDFVDTDTVTVKLPTGYRPEFMPEPTLIESKFGRYMAQTRLDADKLVYLRQWQMHRGRYPATDYTAWVDFRRKVNKADRAQIVLVKPQ